MRGLLVFGMALLPLHGAEEAVAQKSPLECRIRAVHQGGNDVISLKITLENVGDQPIRVMMPCYWYDMSAGSMIGGWNFQFAGPDGKPAKLDWGTPPPGPLPVIPREERVVVLFIGESVGMTLPLQGQLADLEKVSALKVTYEVMENFQASFGLRNVEWLKELRPRLWEGKIESTRFDIAKFAASRREKR